LNCHVNFLEVRLKGSHLRERKVCESSFNDNHPGMRMGSSDVLPKLSRDKPSSSDSRLSGENGMA
jgi:hypothetical protein